MCNNFSELHNLLCSDIRCNALYEVIMMMESWLNINAPYSMLDPNNQYKLVHCDRDVLRIGGGVCVLALKRFNVISIDLSELYPELEIYCVDLMYSDAKCRLFVVHRAPKSDHITRSLECINLLSKVKCHCRVSVDFHCGDVNCQTLKAFVDSIQDELLYFSINNYFLQVVQSATRANNLLDLVFTNELP